MGIIKKRVVGVFVLMRYRKTLLNAIADTEARILNDAISDGIVEHYNIELLKKYQEKCHIIDDALIFI